MLDDLRAVIERPSVLVGASFGGEVALAFADRSPELVSALVLIDAPVPDHEFSEELTAYWAKGNALVEAVDLDGATELTVSFWVGGADDEVKALVREMTRRSLKLQTAGDPDADPGLPEVIDLSTVRAPSLVLAGAGDRADFRAIAEQLARELPRARLAWIEGAQHLPALERPETTARLIDEFLRDLSIPGRL